MYKRSEKTKGHIIDEYEYTPVYDLDWPAAKTQWSYWDSFKKHLIPNIITGGMIGAMVGVTMTVGMLASIGLLALTAPVLGPILFPCLIVCGIVAGILISNGIKTYFDRRELIHESLSDDTYATYKPNDDSQPLPVSSDCKIAKQKTKYRSEQITFSNDKERAFFERKDHKQNEKHRSCKPNLRF